MEEKLEEKPCLLKTKLQGWNSISSETLECKQQNVLGNSVPQQMSYIKPLHGF